MNTKYRWAGALAQGVVLCALASVSIAGPPAPGGSANGAAPYARMAHLEQDLMPDRAEIAPPRSAAPAAISDKATILALKPQGYETAVNGTNGFTCLVERGRTSPFDRPDFWNPKLRGPLSYNPAASKS